MNEGMVEETPWALVQRLRGEGSTFDEIIVALQERGLSRDDLEVLLKDDAGFLAWSRGQADPVAAPSPPQDTPTDTGRILRWSVITLSAIATGLVAAQGTTGLDLAIMGLTLLPALGLLATEFKKGVRRTAKSLGFVLFFAFIAPALSGFIAGWRLPQLLTAPLFLLSVPLLVWASRAREGLEGLADFGHAKVFETGDVQFAVTWVGAKVLGTGESLEMRVHAQNCVDVPRSLNIKIRGDLRSNMAPFEHTLSLEPGCIVEALVPVRVPPLAPERFGFTVDFTGSGAEVGRRVRLAKGEKWVTPTDALVDNLMAAADLVQGSLAVFTLASDGGINVKVDPEKPYSRAALTFQTKVLYRPEPETLAAAATS